MQTPVEYTYNIVLQSFFSDRQYFLTFYSIFLLFALLEPVDSFSIDGIAANSINFDATSNIFDEFTWLYRYTQEFEFFYYFVKK